MKPPHLAGYTESFDSATLQALTALAEAGGLLTVTSTDFLLAHPEYRNVLAAYVFGPSVTRARFAAPSLPVGTFYDIEPLDRSALPAFPLPWLPKWHAPLTFKPDERISVEAAEDGAGATRVSALLWFGAGPLPIGRAHAAQTVRFTRSAGTVTANAWSNLTLTVDRTLPPGIYGVIGMLARSTNLQAARIVFPGGSSVRPGVIGADAVADRTPEMFRYGRLGDGMVWGQFSSENLPTIDVLVNGTDTDQVFYLDLVHLGSSPVAQPQARVVA